MRYLLLLFISVPIIEMWLLIEVGARIGALSTIALVFLTAAVGLALLRQQGANTLLRVRQRMELGKLPAGEILEGVMLAVGGALLLTPGFITDGIGFACLIPFSRQLIVAALLRQGVVMAHYGSGATYNNDSVHTQFTGSHFGGSPDGRSHVDFNRSGSDANTIDGDYRRED